MTLEKEGICVYLRFLLRCGGGMSLGSITLTRALFDGWSKVASVISVAFPLGNCFRILS